MAPHSVCRVSTAFLKGFQNISYRLEVDDALLPDQPGESPVTKDARSYLCCEELSTALQQQAPSKEYSKIAQKSRMTPIPPLYST